MNYDTMAFGVGFVGMVILLILISILPFYFLWNWIMPLFGLPNLTMLQCWGLLLLVQIFRLPTTYMKDK